MKLSRVFVLGFLAAALAISGCSRDRLGSVTGPERQQLAPAARDTTPNPPNPPGPPPSPIPVQFVGSDSTREGETGNTYWRIGNDGGSAQIHWRLQMGSGWTGDPWPSLPIEGDIHVPGNQTRDLTVPVAVPAGTSAGAFPLTLLITHPGGSPQNADGHILVFSDSVPPPPPPPPPPPTPAVEFAGVDSLTPQPTMTFWLLFNESDNLFNMQWTLTSTRNWPGFPINGSQFLSGAERRTVVVTIPVPDTAAVGFNRLFMTVTRPDTLPPQTAQGDFPIVE